MQNLWLISWLDNIYVIIGINKKETEIICRILIIGDVMEIENMIYEIRGKQVMLASDVAKLYHV